MMNNEGIHVDKQQIATQKRILPKPIWHLIFYQNIPRVYQTFSNHVPT
jgi:hypothetical protein